MGNAAQKKTLELESLCGYLKRPLGLSDWMDM